MTAISNADPRDARIRQLEDTLAELKLDVIAFAGPWAAEYALARGLPPGHLYPTHYDILERAGARMDNFVRGNPT